jgi:fructose-1-phosphate kinase PfkB-like protein
MEVGWYMSGINDVEKAHQKTHLGLSQTKLLETIPQEPDEMKVNNK